MSRADFVHLSCRACGTDIRVKRTLAGKRVRCPNDECGETNRVPEDAGRRAGTVSAPGGWLWIVGVPALHVLLGIGIGAAIVKFRAADARPVEHAAAPVARPAAPPPLPRPAQPPPPPIRPAVPDHVFALLDVPADLVSPIPQDPAKQEQRLKDMLDHNQKTLRDAYDRVGRKDPRWDESAHRALDLAARSFSFAIDPPAKPEEIHAAAKEAVAAGCDDPLILYLHARFGQTLNPGEHKEADQAYAKAAQAFKDSKYPPFRRMIAVGRAALQRSVTPGTTEAERKEAAAWSDGSLALLRASAEEDERNADLDGHWLKTCQWAIKVHQNLGVDAKEAFDRVDKVLGETPALEALRLKVKGDFYITYAWEARGSGLANTVTPDGWVKFRERLPVARDALEAAWKVQPDDWFTATRMLSVELGMSRGRAEMERWFERALKANGNNREACWIKMEWLNPKWYGSFEELMAFGKACRATRNWRSGITLLSALPYFYIGQDLRDDKEAQRQYFRLPDIRENIAPVFDEYLGHCPHDVAVRSEYALWNYMMGQNKEAHRHFSQLGDRVIPPVWATREWATQVRNSVAERERLLNPGAADAKKKDK